MQPAADNAQPPGSRTQRLHIRPQSGFTASDIANTCRDAASRADILQALQTRSAKRTAAPAASSSSAGPWDVMISYRVAETGARGDKSVFALQAALEARGYSVFVGEGAIQGADDWPTTIQHGVEASAAFVVLCSPSYGDAVASPWTRRELVMAGNLQKKLLPVHHSGPYPPQAVAIYLSGVQRIPGGELPHGYADSAFTHDDVAAQLAQALLREGIKPSSNSKKAVTAA